MINHLNKQLDEKYEKRAKMSEVQMQSIVRDSLNLDRENRKQIMLMIRRYNTNAVNFKSDGCRIILNKLSKELIQEIYNFIQYKIQS